jgi:uncharacterized protein (DUF305 family)
MSAKASLRTMGLIAAAATALLVTACSVTTSTSTSTTPAGSPASSAPAHLSAADLAWIQSITQLHQQVDKPFRASTINMTRAKMKELGGALRSCQRELGQMAPPSSRLQPAYAKVQQACRTYAKGARCFKKEASVSDAAGAVIAGTAEERIARRADACGFAAEGNGSNLMSEAEAMASAIRAQFP